MLSISRLHPVNLVKFLLQVNCIIFFYQSDVFEYLSGCIITKHLQVLSIYMSRLWAWILHAASYQVFLQVFCVECVIW